MKTFVKSLVHLPFVVSSIARVDVLATWASYRILRAPGIEKRHVVLTTTGHGNIGDQAMFEAFLHNVEGPITAIVPESGAFSVPERDIQRVEIVELSQLIYGRGWSHYRDLFRFGKVLRTAKSYSVTGADIMDGGYNARLSEMEWTTAIAARACALQSQILGFSWNGTPVASVVALAKWAGAAGVRMNVRDPRSFERLDALGVQGIRRSADMVFLLGDSDKSDWSHPAFAVAKSWAAEGRKIALVNCSGLIDVATDLVTDYVSVVEHLLGKDCHVLLIPHVIRPDSDDLHVCRRVVQHVSDPRVQLVDSLLAPRKVKALAEMASVIVTGRMHLSVLGLSVETPSIVLATQGKVEGLMQLFGRPEWNVEPVSGFSSTVLPLLEEVIEKQPGPILSQDDIVRDLARSNFSIESYEMGAIA